LEFESSSLTTLTLPLPSRSGNAMVLLPPIITTLTRLLSLRIREMGLYELPPSLARCLSLTHLDFGGNRLEIAAPEFVYDLTCLTDLRMDCNRFFVIHDAVTRLRGECDSFIL
jgi:Leucine-rich repeat (LRR) protein